MPSKPKPRDATGTSRGFPVILRDGDLRLRPARLPDDVAPAVPWYRDPEVLRLSEGEGTPPYDAATVARMYEHLAAHGELYVIEVPDSGGRWRPIGDAALLADAVPIVIGEAAYRSRGLGGRVLRLLIARARSLGWDALRVSKVFTYNPRSRRLYEGAGFLPAGTGADEAGRPFWRFELRLNSVGT